MRWNPYIDLRVGVCGAVRSKCRQCGAPLEKGSYRAEAIPILGKPELLHLDCAAKRAPDLAQRKIKDRDPDWPADALDDLKRFVPEDQAPAPRSYLRTPILDVSYDREPGRPKPCLFCGLDCPGDDGPTTGHAVRAFSVDGERRFHPGCILRIAPGICRRIALEDSERWPADVKALFAQALANVAPTPRSPWRNTAGIPKLERSPSARAACRFCKEKIVKDELRLAREQLYGMRRSPVYFHVGCYASSDDYHPKMLELVILRAGPEVTREQVEALAAVLPPHAEEDDDVPPLMDRLLTLYDAVPRAEGTSEDDSTDAAGLRENVVEIPEGFFTS